MASALYDDALMVGQISAVKVDHFSQEKVMNLAPFVLTYAIANKTANTANGVAIQAAVIMTTVTSVNEKKGNKGYRALLLELEDLLEKFSRGGGNYSPSAATSMIDKIMVLIATIQRLYPGRLNSVLNGLGSKFSTMLLQVVMLYAYYHWVGKGLSPKDAIVYALRQMKQLINELGLGNMPFFKKMDEQIDALLKQDAQGNYPNIDKFLNSKSGYKDGSGFDSDGMKQMINSLINNYFSQNIGRIRWLFRTNMEKYCGDGLNNALLVLMLMAAEGQNFEIDEFANIMSLTQYIANKFSEALEGFNDHVDPTKGGGTWPTNGDNYADAAKWAKGLLELKDIMDANATTLGGEDMFSSASKGIDGILNHKDSFGKSILDYLKLIMSDPLNEGVYSARIADILNKQFYPSAKGGKTDPGELIFNQTNQAMKAAIELFTDKSKTTGTEEQQKVAVYNEYINDMQSILNSIVELGKAAVQNMVVS